MSLLDSTRLARPWCIAIVAIALLIPGFIAAQAPLIAKEPYFGSYSGEALGDFCPYALRLRIALFCAALERADIDAMLVCVDPIHYEGQAAKAGADPYSPDPTFTARYMIELMRLSGRAGIKALDEVERARVLSIKPLATGGFEIVIELSLKGGRQVRAVLGTDPESHLLSGPTR